MCGHFFSGECTYKYKKLNEKKSDIGNLKKNIFLISCLYRKLNVECFYYKCCNGNNMIPFTLNRMEAVF